MDFKYPYTDFHELNLDWFLAEFKKLTEAWLQVQQDWADEQQAYQDLHDYVENYFANLDLYQEVHDVLWSPEMQGNIQIILSNLTTNMLPGVVADQITAVVASQLSTVVALQLPAVVADKLPTVLPGVVAGEASDWLAAHVDPATGYVIDDTMSISLAAADAATVGDLFDDTNDKVGKLDYNVNKIWTDPDITTGTGYISNLGSIVADASCMYKKTRCFGCSEGQKWYYQGRGDGSAAAWLFYHGTTLVGHGNANSVSDYTEVTIPSNVNGIVFCSYRTTGDIDEVVLDVRPALLSNGEKGLIRENINAASYHMVSGTNLYDNSWYIDDQRISGQSIISIAGSQTSTIIHLPQGDYLISCAYSYYGAVGQSVRITDNTGAYVTTIQAPLVITNGNDSVMAISITNPDGCGIMFNTRKTLDRMIVRGTTASDWPASYVPFDPDKKTLDDDIYMNNYMLSEISEAVNSSNPLYKKYIAADGDSISYGNGYAGGYAKIIADDNSMDYQNLSVGGATITAEVYESGNPRHWVCRSMVNISSDADYILIEGGVNDASLHVPLGSITAGYTDALDDSTFYGAVESIFKTLTTVYVGKKYGFIIPHRMTSGMYSGGSYYDAIKECASKWGVKVLDLTESVPPFNAFRGTADYDTVRTAYTTSGDGWHPTELCYRKYYVPQIEAFIKTL